MAHETKGSLRQRERERRILHPLLLPHPLSPLPSTNYLGVESGRGAVVQYCGVSSVTEHGPRAGAVDDWEGLRALYITGLELDTAGNVTSLDEEVRGEGEVAQGELNPSHDTMVSSCDALPTELLRQLSWWSSS